MLRANEHRYNLECGYSESTPRATVKRKATDDGTSHAAPDPPVPRPAAIQSDVAQNILARLEELAQRTANIENQIQSRTSYASSSGKRRQAGSVGRALPSMDELGLTEPSASASHRRMGNPMSTIVESFEHMDDGLPLLNGIVNGVGTIPSQAPSPSVQPGPHSPDAVSRGLISMPQAETYFAFFIDHCTLFNHGYVPEHLSDPIRLRWTSPLLFGAVLCVSAYYVDAPRGEEGLQLYLSLVGLVTEILAPIVMSPDSAELDDDFVLGIAIITIWKMPRIRPRGMVFSNFAQMQNLAKLNNATTYFLSGIAGRAARVNGLYEAPALFLAGDISPNTLKRVRLWMWMCFIDAHGCAQNGRAASLDPTEALQVTRIFANLNDAPKDVELAALLEVSCIYGKFHGTSEDDRTDLIALARANSDLDSITNYWYQRYPELVYDGSLVTQIIAPFHRLMINADVYRTWSVRNKIAMKRGASEPPGLSDEEASYLAVAVDSAVTLLLYLTTSAKIEGGHRAPRFEEPQYWKDGRPVYRPMEPDAEHAKKFRTAVDTIICVMLCFSAMFLAKLRAANLMRCNLSIITPRSPLRKQDMENGGRIALYSKFFRIIELASDFLEMAAPNSAHPCMTQSRVLRQLLATASVHISNRNPNGTDRKPSPAGSSSHGRALSNDASISSIHTPQSATPISMPRYPHTLIGQPTLDHSADSPLAAPPAYGLQPLDSAPLPPTEQQQLPNHNLNDMMTSIGQPGNPLVSSFLGGDEWSMLMTSLGLQQQ